MSDVTRKAGAREWTGLAVLALPTLLLSLDQSVLFLALPSLAEALRPTGNQMLWIMDIYGFLMAGFLVTMGTLGDRIGRRRLLLIGAAAVLVTSLLAAYSGSAEMLIVSRALLGVAAATIMPSTLALIGNMFHDPAQRGRAFALWASCFMVGTALGPVVGGLLLEHFWWGSAFLLGVPVMLILLVAGPMLLPEYKAPVGGKLDLISVVLSLAGILPVIYGIKEIAKYGFDVMPVAAALAGLIMGALFVLRQGRLEHPVVDVTLFRNGAFTASLLIQVILMVAVAGSYLFITGFLQMVQGLSPMHAGLWMVPSAIASIVSAQLAPGLAKRFSTAAVIAAGLAVAAAGYVAIAFVDPVGGLPLLVIGFVIAFFGTGPIGALGTNLIVSAAPPEKSGSAASLSETASHLGVAVGIATLGSLGSIVYRSSVTVPDGVPATDAETVRNSLEGALAAAQDLTGSVAGQLLAGAREAYTSGLNVVAVVCAAFAAATALIALTALRKAGTDSGQPSQGDKPLQPAESP
ncbi:MFS transporter [Nonomuraea turcica]|uniref:MFS transporter n=1 Tax=Nonomuraea sp. G32 TaxID=3067274 RepID=UPI00273B2E89|nr:MFS transporter [Nonomuraea sp. G32]MDP4511867.1 MFS transporter [Nonomuraea sp. G32]